MIDERELLDRIERPRNEELQSLLNEAVDTTRDRLAEWGFQDVDSETLRKLSYTYYYDSAKDNPQYVFLLQDPGGLQRRHTEELDRLRTIDYQSDSTELIDIFRQFPKSWLLGNRNSNFSERFFSTLAEKGLISLSQSWRDYLRTEQFYDDFYMTDVVKYRVDGFNKAEEQASVNEFLSEELSMLDPELVFAFGGDAWSALQTYFDARPVERTTADTSKITEMHGILCEADGDLDADILPLSHMSGQVWWRFPPDAYIRRLDDGLTAWKEHR